MLANSLSGMRHKIVPVPNRGYDVGPFVEYVLNRPDFASFDYVIKIHTKRDSNVFLFFHRFRDGDWRRDLLSFCSTPKAMHRSLRAFERAPRLGMVAGPLSISRGGFDYTQKAIIEIHDNGKRFGIESREATVVWGTMFMARTKCLVPLAQRFKIEDFEEIDSTNAHKPYSLAHLLEAVFAFAVTSQGYFVGDGKWPYPLAWIGSKLMFVVGRTWRFISSRGRL